MGTPGGAGIVLLLAACATPRADPGPLPWRLELPAALASWEPAIRADLAATLRRWRAVAGRWPETTATGAEAAPRVLALAPDLAAARALAARLGLPGDPTVARTWPGRRLALVPLPRRDRLLARLPAPPRTLAMTLRHEAVHLLALDRAALADAPVWFQEGLAELLATRPEDLDDPWSGAGAARLALAGRLASLPGDRSVLPLLADLPGELRYAAWAELVGAALVQDSGPEPWTRVRSWTVTTLRDRLPPPGRPGLTGREVDTCPGGRGPALLASRPGEAVELRWPEVLAAGDRRSFRLEPGPSTAGEASVLLAASSGRRLRLRLRPSGQLRADWEDAGAPTAATLGGVPPSSPAGSPRILEIRLGDRGLELRSGAWRRRFPWDAAFTPPLTVAFQVRDGVLALAPAGT